VVPDPTLLVWFETVIVSAREVMLAVSDGCVSVYRAALAPVSEMPVTVTVLPFATDADENVPAALVHEIETSPVSPASTAPAARAGLLHVMVAVSDALYSLLAAVTPEAIATAFRDTVKLWSTSGAGLRVPSPAWDATIVQVPTLTSVTLVPETVHTSGVEEEKVTVRVEDAVADNVTESPYDLSARLSNVMVWFDFAASSVLKVRVAPYVSVCTTSSVGHGVVAEVHVSDKATARK
jgi:hypothetical protein